jgi:uncharacterized protein (TIGR03545 family)
MAKQKSIFRYEAILPIALLIGGIAIYSQLFLDAHLRRALEWSLSNAMGAEVTVQQFETHLYKGRLFIGTIDMTDPDKPTQNILSLQKIELSLSWDALLRGKVVINEALVIGIATQTPRKHPGKVYPKSKEPSLVATEFQKLSQTALNSLQNNNADTLFGNALSLLNGKEMSFSSIEAQLQSPKLLSEFEQKLQNTQNTWQTSTSAFTDPLPGLEKKVSLLQNISFKSVTDAQKWLENANALQTDIQNQIQKIDAAQSNLNKDITSLSSTFGKINNSINQDMQTVGTYIQIPKIPENQLSSYLLNTYLGKYLEHYETAKNWADTYLPPNLVHKKEQTKITAIPRRKGILYTYGRQNSYPLFWLKLAEISSKPSRKNPNIGAITGRISNLSTDQELTRQPLEGQLTGDFPGLSIEGVDLYLKIDRRGASRDLFTFKINKYPIQKLTFLESGDMQIALNKASGRLAISAERTDKHLAILFTQYFDNVLFDVHAGNTILNDISKAAFSSITEAQIDGSLEGPMDNLSFRLESNLGPLLAKNFSDEIDKRLQMEKNRIQNEISQKIDAEKQKIQAQLDQFTANYTRLLQTQENELRKIEKNIATLQADAQSQVTAWQKEAEAKLEAEKNKVLDKAQKKLLDTFKKPF